LLGPLASLTDLPTHPSLSLPYLSGAIPDLIDQASQMLRIEQLKLLQAKQLLEKFLGDDTWIPCGVIEEDDDEGLFDPDFRSYLEKKKRAQERAILEEVNIVKQKTIALDAISVDNATQATNGEHVDDSTPAVLVNGDTTESDKMDIVDDTKKDNGVHMVEAKVEADQDSGKIQNLGQHEDEEMQDESSSKSTQVKDEDSVDGRTTRRMTTRAQAQASTQDDSKAGSDSASRPRSPSTISDIQIPHPIYLIPQITRPSRDWGLPPTEAEDTRRLLLMLVQKREESVLGLQRLRDGLLKSNKLRARVFKWSKAEAHVGEMSDGEDWYDKEEWGLDADLKKGQEEDESDAAAAQRKPTRTRRG
jgi:hypothetical protein